MSIVDSNLKNTDCGNPQRVGNEWWRGAIIYQIYPRSFFDSNNDGVGDLPGITSKLDYIASLGVDAIWISPFFKSPMKDFGYDVSDYRAVDPVFGTLADFDDLVLRAHELNIRVIIDQVLSHTSSQHTWFRESRQNRTNAKADWYVWADPKSDGTPPNNWLSIFGGPAWQWDARRNQYYLHNFLVDQPDLNFHNPQLQSQMLKEVEFWLQRNVDGIRLDAINFCFHDAQLRDNPPKSRPSASGEGFRKDNPYAWQAHLYNNTQAENHQFLEALRELSNSYGDVLLLGEISSEDTLQTMVDYTSGNRRLHTGYSFKLLTDDLNTRYIRETIETAEFALTNAWPCWTLGNHDVTRVASRWRKGRDKQRLAKVLNAFLFSLRGTVCSYQGEELALTEAELEESQLRDPYGLNFWPLFKGRDGCRTPLPWTSSEHGGFSASTPWLPVPEVHRKSCIANQAEDEASALNAYRTFVAWRKQIPALLCGNIRFVDSPADSLVFVREIPQQNIYCAFNFGPDELRLTVPGNLKILSGHGFSGGRLDRDKLTLPAYVAFYADVKTAD